MSEAVKLDATVYLWSHTDTEGKVSRGADVVCASCQMLRSVIVDYSRCDRREVDPDLDGTVEASLATDEASQRDYTKRWRRVRCCLCPAIVAEEEL